MEVLTGRYCLGKHCDAVRRYLLLGQGDFVQTFMELVRETRTLPRHTQHIS